jgi:hypothetical protein
VWANADPGRNTIAYTYRNGYRNSDRRNTVAIANMCRHSVK